MGWNAVSVSESVAVAENVPGCIRGNYLERYISTQRPTRDNKEGIGISIEEGRTRSIGFGGQGFVGAYNPGSGARSITHHLAESGNVPVNEGGTT